MAASCSFIFSGFLGSSCEERVFEIDKLRDIDNITNAVKSKFEGSVEGKMKVSFVLFKTESNGTLSCIAYCYLSSAAAEAAKESARQQAMSEAVKDAESVKDFNASVNEIIEAGK